jgi:hypothetical protein
MLPHLRTRDLTGTDEHALAWVDSRAADYLLRRGDVRAGHALANQLYESWSQRLGPDHQHTRWATTHLAHALHSMGKYRETAHGRNDPPGPLWRSTPQLGSPKVHGRITPAVARGPASRACTPASKRTRQRMSSWTPTSHSHRLPG